MITQSLTTAADAEVKSKKESLDKIQIPKDILPKEKMPEAPYNVIFRLVKKKKGRSYLDNFSDVVPNPDNDNMPERMCLLAGASDVWESKCENIIKDKRRYDRARRGMDILFVDGVCRVRSTDKLRLKFLRLHPKNVGSNRSGSGGFDFYEYNPAVEQEERHQKQILKLEIINKVMGLNYDDNGYGRKLAAFCGVPMVDELGMKKSPKGIMTELAIKADNDPVTIQKYLDSKEVEVSWLVKRAIIDSKIDLGGATGNAMWANGKGFIAKIPSTRKAYEYLTELALQPSDEGRLFLEQLKTIVV